jgi:ABC-type lipoprotein release transport system permease subunit
MNKRDLFRVLLQMSILNLRSHRGKTLIVGSIMFFGTFLWTMGSSLVGSVERAMSATIIDSFAGDLQIYQDETRDKLAFFGGGSFGAPDIGEIPRYQDVVDMLQGVPNIKALVPQGATVALLSNPSLLDEALSDLRSAVRKGDAAGAEDAKARVRYLVAYVRKEIETRAQGQNLNDEVRKNIADLGYATAATFWADFDPHAIEKLEFLDTRIAPLGSTGTLNYMRIMGTDFARFAKTFGRFEITQGTLVPEGERGFLMSGRFVEVYLKNKVARELDDMQAKLAEGRTFATDEALREQAARNVKQYKRLLFALDPAHQDDVRAALAAELGRRDGDLDVLMQEFLKVDDTNFARRFQFFYAAIAPVAELYPVKVGEVVTLRAFTRSGYMRGANLKLYGLFAFKGMEDSDIAAAYNLMDMMTFREMYGAPSAEQKAELAGIKASLGVSDVTRDRAEAELFGGSGLVVEAQAPAKSQTEPDVLEALKVDTTSTFTAGDVDQGLVLNVAVVLQDQGKVKQTKAQIAAAIKKSGHKLRVVDWQEAAGMVGQLILAMRAVLLFGMVIIFLVALVVINNTVIISVMERINEIGTLRAIGAQRPFILWMFLLENMAIAALAGVAGALAGAGLIGVLGKVGIPAFSKNINFLFGGPRLYPTVGVTDVVGGLMIILTVSAIATLLPARSATRVQPVEAMRDTD